MRRLRASCLMIILGINTMHDSSAALVADGRVVAAAEEERFTRVKHQTGFPKNAIRCCLEDAGITIRDVDAVGVAWKPWVLGTRLLTAIEALPFSASAFFAKAGRGIGQMGNEWKETFFVRSLIEKEFGKGSFKLHYLDHHLCHASSAFLPSPYDKAAILTVDGAGEAVTTAFWRGEGTGIRLIDSIKLPHSLGQFYAAMTGFLGFKIQSDEYKVMGLASYGEPSKESPLNGAIRLEPGGRFTTRPVIDYHLARRGLFLPKTVRLLGLPRSQGDEITKAHKDLAATAQNILEEALFHMAGHLASSTGSENLCLAGGVALNCVANGKLFDRTPFRSIFIQPAAGDNGTALGAALYLYHKYTKRPRAYVMRTASLGPSFSMDECRRAVKDSGLAFKEVPGEEVPIKAAEALASGKLVCWFQGRMEWGPRALGNRSMLADPRKASTRDLINLKVKQRESFRPFAPSVLEERSREYFSNPIPSPFMLFAFKVDGSKAAEIPAVVHVDGTARPQTVDKETHPRYWRLIKEFERLTSVPIVLNTSFNVQEPIVCTPAEAISSFLRTKVDLLVLEDLFVEQSGAS